ncbi:co-chaperone HscB [Saccharobesus litoralis]|uniref:Co-chaperone protein HscB homolog n=1 Tax=Saccharobesus litoralis TaxID=2172099 RepID=A0A2S0VTH9_9ALTE|nr:co-chaperone HscB [Saccharobesus litoralis]AWB67482.1 co-chaperone HscB [Saccharobesus litoralis]
MNYFELFNIAESFAVDVDAITQTYRELQKQYHPDKFATANDQDKLAVVQKSAEINDAYTTLKHPVSRAEYLLKLRGLDIQHETQTLQDPSFLMQQMEYRERLEDIAALAEPFDAVVEFEQELESEIAGFQQKLTGYIESNENEAAANTIRKLKFMFKLVAELERLEDEQLAF